MIAIMCNDIYIYICMCVCRIFLRKMVTFSFDRQVAGGSHSYQRIALRCLSPVSIGIEPLKWCWFWVWAHQFSGKDAQSSTFSVALVKTKQVSVHLYVSISLLVWKLEQIVCECCVGFFILLPSSLVQWQSKCCSG